ncbi:MAG: hypothetical protein IJ379_13020, partial [Lachnospiraceae bacterium]|nr:hypothetical protein [Lachnospiraceae bacterium]
MSKVRGRALAFVLAFCMVFTNMFTQYTTQVMAASEGAGTLKSCSIKIGGQELTEDTVVKNGDPLEIQFNWSLDNNDQTSTEFVVDLGNIKGIQITTGTTENDLKQGSDTVGTYYIEDNKLHIKLYKENAFFGENERTGGVRIEGIVQVNDGDVDDNNETTIGVGQYNVTVKYDDNITIPQPWVSVDKYLSGGLTTDAGGQMYQTFGAKITANNNDVTGLKLTDTAGSGMTFSDATQITVTGGVIDGTYTGMDAVNAALSGVTLPKDSSIELTYQLPVSEEVYKESANFDVKGNTLQVDYLTNEGTPAYPSSDGVTIEVTNAPDINKAGTLSADQKTATWTITVDLGKFYAEGKSLADMLEYVQDT